jgi:hypothetical protein
LPRITGEVRQRHPPEMAAVDMGNAVMPRQTLVQEGVVGVEQIEQAAVVADDAAEQHLRFALERRAQVVVEVPGFGLKRVEVAQEQPLSGEVLDQGVGLRIRDHPAHLLLEHGRILQPAGDREIQQFVVGDAAPEEEREPRRQREIADRIDGARGRPGRSVFGAEQERWRHQDA